MYLLERHVESVDKLSTFCVDKSVSSIFQKTYVDNSVKLKEANEELSTKCLGYPHLHICLPIYQSIDLGKNPRQVIGTVESVDKLSTVFVDK
jgi:hypothetical protein